MGTDGNPKDLLNPMMCVAIWATTHEIKHCVGGKILDDCPLVEIGTCKDCKYWDKDEEYCKHLSNENGWLEDEDYRVNTESDFYCADFERRGDENEAN
jgi:hypothetical protein